MHRIARPRVIDRLHAAARRPVVLIAAPAGYGKSVALQQYLATLNEPWIRFDPSAEHAALLGFLGGFCDAIAPYAPHARATLSGAYERSRTSPAPAADLALWMHAHLRGFGGVVAIDDLHVAAADRGAAEFVGALIERSKHEIRWVIASRSTAGLPVATWLAYGDADLAVDERDLRFTLDEAAEAAAAARLAIRSEELGELLELTGGWPTAVGFALRTSTRCADLRSIAVTTREMIYRYCAEQVYDAFDPDERDLLAVATALPSIDIDVLEAAGFDRALRIVEGLRERTAFIYEESPRNFRLHDLFREFLRRQIERDGRERFEAVHGRAASALEAAGDFERALGAYVLAGRRDDALRVLERHGFDLLERARGDAVGRAIDGLDEPRRRENARVLALRAMLNATAGKNARAEALFRRSLARAGEDRELVAIASLRLAILLMNLGRDTGELLEAFAEDRTQSHNYRAEALSIVTAQRASLGDLERARRGIERLDALLVDVDSEPTRAKVLQRMGVALTAAGEAERAVASLLEAAELANELHLFSLASRAFAALSNLAVQEDDDGMKGFEYAEQAWAGATKAGDVVDAQASLLQMLGVEMRHGNAERSLEIERELERLAAGDSGLTIYTVVNRAIRAGWEGRFDEAHRALAGCLQRVHFEADRLALSAQCAFYLALLGRRDESIELVRDVTALLEKADTRGTFRIRAAAIARMLCALAEAIAGRTTRAERLVRAMRCGVDPVATICGRTAKRFAEVRRRSTSDGTVELLEAATSLATLGYGDIALLLEAAAGALPSPPQQGLGEALTPAERDVLSALADGATPKEIASRDGRSVFTIQAHIANAIAKLGCHGRAEAINLARKRGWLAKSSSEF